MRFFNIKERNFFSIISYFSHNFVTEYANKIKDTKWNLFKWKDLTLMKDPMTLSIYLQLLQDVKPKTILEFGTYEGGSSLWMKDMAKSLGFECEIHTFDIDENKVKLTQDDDINFYCLDNYDIKKFVVDNKNLLSNLESPILVVEDSHENVMELLTEIDQFLSKDDYLIVEDTIDEQKHQQMLEFLENDKYEVDTHYCDFWGYNNTWNFNSFLRKK